MCLLFEILLKQVIQRSIFPYIYVLLLLEAIPVCNSLLKILRSVKLLLEILPSV